MDSRIEDRAASGSSPSGNGIGEGVRQDILVLFAHPDLRESRVNKRLLDAAASLPRVRVRDLYALYPDYHIEVEDEQQQIME